MNIEFGNTFNGNTNHIHEATGRPYLCVTLYGQWFDFLRPPHLMGGRDDTWWIRLFVRRGTTEDGKTFYAPRKLPNAPYRALYRFWSRHQDTWCQLGWHHKADITEADGSVVDAECIHCHRLIPPHKPKPPNAEWAAYLEEQNRKGMRMHEEIMAQLAEDDEGDDDAW